MKDLSSYIHELKHIEYDRQALEDFYYEIKHRERPYIEMHVEDPTGERAKSPYFRCICKDCLPTGKHAHSGEDHKVIRRLERYKNPEVDRLTEQMEYITHIDGVRNTPVMWIYEPGFNLPPHKDFARNCSVMVPILPAEGGSNVYIYKDDLPVIDNGEYLTVEHNDDYVHHVYEYGTKHPTALNASEVIHGVINTERRVFINFSGYLDWENI